jgi:hypothetical protein
VKSGSMDGKPPMSIVQENADVTEMVSMFNFQTPVISLVFSLLLLILSLFKMDLNFKIIE